jgi:hypothetical protein
MCVCTVVEDEIDFESFDVLLDCCLALFCRDILLCQCHQVISISMSMFMSITVSTSVYTRFCIYVYMYVAPAGR